MSKNKPGPYILLAVLIIILIFVLGVRYGQKVEKTNKTINYLISLAPTKPVPTEIPLQFNLYKNAGCGIDFLVPAALKKEKEASLSAQFTKQNKLMIEFSCEKNNPLAAVLENINIATAELKFKNQKILAKQKDNNYIFSFINVTNAKNIIISITQSLYPLFETSLKY